MTYIAKFVRGTLVTTFIILVHILLALRHSAALWFRDAQHVTLFGPTTTNKLEIYLAWLVGDSDAMEIRVRHQRIFRSNCEITFARIRHRHDK